jgi:hypothetical protein
VYSLPAKPYTTTLPHRYAENSASAEDECIVCIVSLPTTLARTRIRAYARVHWVGKLYTTIHTIHKPHTYADLSVYSFAQLYTNHTSPQPNVVLEEEPV